MFSILIYAEYDKKKLIRNAAPKDSVCIIIQIVHGGYL